MCMQLLCALDSHSAADAQGGAMALMVLRTSTTPLAGVLSMSAYLPLADSPPLVSPANLATPVLFCHGTEDDTVCPCRACPLTFGLWSIDGDSMFQCHGTEV